ncbi:MAG: sensor histidine kinase [Bdellovibrionales bacterium]
MMEIQQNLSDHFRRRVQEVFSSHYELHAKKTDRLFAYLFIFQWLLGIGFALLISPLTWAGEYSQTHIHVYAAIFLGAAITGLPVFMILKNPGAPINRMVVAVSQILFSILFIHLTGGRIETHFHIFGSLAFLAFYRDWRPVLIGTVVTAADHLLRGAFWPESVYGVLTATPWRALEHAAWVIFEDSILWYSIKIALGELQSVSESQVRLEDKTKALQLAHDEVAQLNSSLEAKVAERTRQLQESQQKILSQQQTLMSSSKMSALGEMAGGVAHEINNPLAVIMSLSGQLQEVIDEDPLDRSLIKSMSNEIENTTTRIAKIVQGLRSFSRDGSKDAFHPVNLHELIEDTLSFCSERFKHNDTKIIIDDFKKDLSFFGRATELSQVLLNLLNNAHDAISGFQDKWIKISIADEQSYLDIQVTDCGSGVPHKVREKIFQPFFTTKEIGKGTGMGLSISSGIIRRHGGELKLDTQCPNTRFVIRIPKKQVKTAAA